ncbi:MAG: hypothetical protein A2Y04_04470 [Omnitrophica WOR_2 bacterium GWC2_45_7]|uniref:ATP synthase gamma chain n=1 Tax=candidate division CPR1 bacterium GW2011_GWA2_42_17 TaxID=1618341 RepID=A0A0G0Z7P7_9BACT|nr:MAG: hypothetical protein UV05_C0001G0017 [candidate division CPR1 bacterium GW2011_GWA2_42_17]OGX18417.1 MAG: hypothetical protein A2Y04_04470 [Omnitrophica WOR_2 bacterium GWC2_45_7]
MGKANKVKKELSESVEMVYLIQTLKDIADNKYFTLSGQKYKFRRFAETFNEFFRMINLTKVDHPLLKNKNPVIGIVVVTVEGSFLGEFNNKIISRAIKEKENHVQTKFIAVGSRGVERLSAHTADLKVFSNMEKVGTYETAILVKDYLIEEIMQGRLGKIIVCYAWPKDFDTQKQRCLKLLPCDELLTKQAQTANIIEKVIEESDPLEAVGYLSHLWVTTRLYELFMDTVISSAAAQAAFLEDSVDKMKKEKKKTLMKYRKAKNNDIDKSLRETFSARMMSMKL